MDLSEFFNSINKTKKNIMADDRAEKAYVPFVVNRSLSYHKDAIFHVNMINGWGGLDRRMQYEYLLYALPKGNRYGKWHKEQEDATSLIMAYYGYSKAKALAVLPLLTESDLKSIKESLNTGGKS
jgi:hypothetical protein